MSYTGGELQRRPPNAPVPYRHGGQHSGGDASSVVNWPELAAWTRGRGVMVVGLVLIALSLIWKATFLSHYYFWQDDFHFTELALGHSLNWSYLTYVGAGHMSLGLYAIVWLWARAALYSWSAASGITIIMLAAAGIAALRLLRTLFGNRPAILILLVIYLISPLTMPDIRWWTVAIEALPLQVALFMALNAQVHYVRTGRFRHALVVAAWLLVGLAFFEKALVLPLLLFLVTSAFLVGEGNWLRSIARCLLRYWPSWLLQLVILGGYAVVLKNALKTSTIKPSAPSSAGSVISFTWNLLKESFVPGVFGGPWQWFPQPAPGGPEWAYASPPSLLVWLSLVAAACVILVSIWARRYAWRAWAILAVWYLAADVVPVVLGRIGNLSPGLVALLGLETHYVSDAVPVLAICLGLAFLPLDGIADLRQKRRMAPAPGFSFQPGRMATAAVVGAFTIGSVFTTLAFQGDTTSLPVRIFMANAKVAVSDAPAGTIVYDAPVPSSLMIGLFAPPFKDASGVIGPTESAVAKTRIRWITQPDGTIDHLMTFGSDGRLHTVDLYGPASVPLGSQQRGCYPGGNGQLVVRFTGKTGPGQHVLRVAYLAASAANGQNVSVKYGSVSRRLTLKAGLHDAYLPVSGNTNNVVVSGGPAALSGLCIGGMRSGFIFASKKGVTIPAGS